MQQLTDQYNRSHDYLRISLTDNCNLRCFYCMPDENYLFSPSYKLMQTQEIRQLAGIFVELGVKKIRLTGGEPLVRKDAPAILEALSELPVELTLTTNGTLVHRFINLMKDAGIGSVNISLDTLSPDKFLFITRRDEFRKVKNNIDLLLNRGFGVKINVVVMKGLNDAEIPDFIAWTKDLPVQIRFIEFMPFTGNRWSSNKVVTWQEIMHTAGQSYAFMPLTSMPNETAKTYRVNGYIGSFAVISTMSAPFCSSCNRMRLTADGKMKNCLFSKEETDLLAALRAGEPIVPLIERSVWNKQKELGGQFSADLAHVSAGSIQNRSMIAIGG
ncbi:GTP 3',8-cyclase MoaA [Sediminibacterium soli]|uniref:GTP 3',8-cyclase MoaA n=1 Tax=Sediminibacterium soli TaxID=2698829 RepID=UPI00137B3D6E|nr:GTP 3',8-cyclase MoaA [Sediminibacterium soli]NCI47696.1 GTP 3',8-cyclase MoaA [Sediminibacterium soli]